MSVVVSMEINRGITFGAKCVCVCAFVGTFLLEKTEG